jgi:osmotically-inducible protein OsmY
MRGSPGRSAQLRWLPPLGFVIPLFAGALLVGPVSGQAAPEDRALAQRIEEQTRQDESLAGTRVIVHARQGAIVLSGMVRLYSQKIRYEQIAWESPGVREVENEIRVIPALPLSDAEIARRIVAMAQEDQRLHGAGVKAEVNEGFVRLVGTFDHPADVLFLKYRVAEIEGVVGMEIDARFRV